jgi:hypothetical protein
VNPAYAILLLGVVGAGVYFASRRSAQPADPNAPSYPPQKGNIINIKFQKASQSAITFLVTYEAPESWSLKAVTDCKQTKDAIDCGWLCNDLWLATVKATLSWKKGSAADVSERTVVIIIPLSSCLTAFSDDETYVIDVLFVDMGDFNKMFSFLMGEEYADSDYHSKRSFTWKGPG